MADNTAQNATNTIATEDVGGVHYQKVIAVDDPRITYEGRASTFLIPGAAGTTGQKLFTLHNASGSTKLVGIKSIGIDLTVAAATVVTVYPPVMKVHRITVLPTAGATLAKVNKDTAQTSSASVTLLQGASADATAAAITATIPANSVLTQEFASRLITGAGYEPMDRADFSIGGGVVLRALEGICVELHYTLATQNATGARWLATVDWREYDA